MFGEKPHDTQQMSQTGSANMYGGYRNARTLSSIQKWACLFGDVFGQLGFVFILIGGASIWAILPLIDFTPITFSGADLRQTSGEIREVEKTNVSEGGGEHSKGTPVYANHFEIDVGGKSYAGVSYSLGRSVAPGDRVTVDYVASDPSVSRIQGMRANMLPMVVLFVLSFPLVGIGLVCYAYRRGKVRLHLLEYGVRTTGGFLRKEASKMFISSRRNNSQVHTHRRVYKYFYSFTDDKGVQREASGSTHKWGVFDETEGAEEEILYDPFNSNNAAVLRVFPAGLRVTQDDRVQAKTSTPLYLLAPFLAVVVNLVALVFFIT